VSEPLLDVVIACHDLSRPIERAVASVLHDDDTRDSVRVTVVAHGLPAAPFEDRLSGIGGSWRVEAFADGIRSPAGPFNRGLDLATAEYAMIMGSDDFLEPGAVSAGLGHVARERPSAAILRLRHQGHPIVPNPPTRVGRSQYLDAAKDRLFYRSAPLALIARSELDRLGLRMTEGVAVGEDVDFGIRLWSLAERVDLLAHAPAYVVGRDADERTTHAVLSIERTFESVARLLDSDLPARMSAAHRRALAVKLARINVIGAALWRREPATWRDDAEVAELGGILRRVAGLVPGALTPLDRRERLVLDGLLDEPTVARVTADVAAYDRAGRASRWLARNPLHSLDRESTLRRYIVQYAKRDRSSAG